jgi:hypothetical protein
MIHHLMGWVSSAAVTFNVLVSVLFIVGFHFHRKYAWRYTWFGQSVMILAVAVLMFSMLGLLQQVLGPNYWGQEVLRLVARILVSVAMTQRLWVLFRIERTDTAASKMDY